ncbi:type III-B CRISPR module RAMP protein Cmr6 [Pasteurella skyensis]|uniref:Type III-B CRISPR module RAMP protein Cmr6 n=1 Tax=Phocoenobacter skyensis TaxID=97481 RepID=A0AAJ6NCX3_9PAST|nr:type III-B CRISPR module RAMP protein Cmr6 [Pasteurella skyensis]MDP8170530.1 type III-B CRISPR module RAMP protein Cmr6 [Pasteurella skyensis]MDP8174508.1 type III-B CRISPR module RAMP protein Cmr6 [Pasteurella skyensis]
MGLPIYSTNSPNAEHLLPDMGQANKGLRFERFFNKYNIGEHSIDKFKPNEDAKKDFLKVFVNACGDREALKCYAQNQMALANAQGGNGKVYQLDGHFVTGMGNSHPVENGLLWHYTLGVPYLSGSQVKGLVRSLIEQYYQADDKTDILLKWFGSEDKDPQKQKRDNQVGELIFFDAIPIVQPTLSVDIMTPHMGDWYAKGGDISNVTRDSDKIPADWHDPNPIPFLAVKEAKFLFTIAKRPKSDIDIEDVFKCLDQALMYCGAGAKTQTGYGVMSFSKEETKSLTEIIDTAKKQAEESKKLAEAKANASELQAKLLDDIVQNHWRDVNDKAKQHFTDSLKSEWLEALENNADDRGCIELLFEIANIHYAKQIKNPKNKKVKPHQREWILRLLALVER